MKTIKEENPKCSDYPLQDEFYRRYREERTEDERLIAMEYEPTITTTYGTVPVSGMKSTLEIEKERRKRLESLKNEVNPSGACPFKGNSMNRTCDKGCAWFNGSGCAVVKSPSPEKELKGTCPISHRTCQNNCTFWSDSQCKLMIKMVCG